MSAFIETLQLLNKFSQLPEGWHFSEGVPSAQLPSLHSGILLKLGYKMGLKDTEAFPGITGEIQLNFYNKDDALEYIFEVDGTINVTLEKNEEFIRLGEGVRLESAINFLTEFKSNRCHSYVSSILTTTTPNAKTGFLVWRSALIPQQASRLLTKNARWSIAKAFATISAPTMRSPQVRQSFSGTFQKTKFPQLVKPDNAQKIPIYGVTTTLPAGQKTKLRKQRTG